MVKIFKSLRDFVNETCYKWYQKLSSKADIKKNLRPDDVISKQYKKEIKEYYAQFGKKVSTDWHRFYSSRNGIKDVKYIPNDIYYSEIEPYFNNLNFRRAYEDKSLHSIWFPDLRRPVTITKNVNGIFFTDDFQIIDEEKAIKLCIQSVPFIIKPNIESGGGRNVSFYSSDTPDAAEIKKIFDGYKSNFVVQEVIKQHKDIAQINPQSINTIRVISLYFKGKVNILSSILRMGANGSRVDNYNSGGMCAGIHPNGELFEFGIDNNYYSVDRHPQGLVFKGFKVPGYEKVIEIVKREHCKFAHFGFIAWDFAISPDEEPIFIEFNLGCQGQNQTACGLAFGDLTDDILTEVYGKKF